MRDCASPPFTSKVPLFPQQRREYNITFTIMFNFHCSHFLPLAIVFTPIALHVVGCTLHTSHIILCAMPSVQKYTVATASQLGELPITRHFRDLECSASTSEDDTPLLPDHLSLLRRRQEKRGHQRPRKLSDPSALPIDSSPIEIPRALVLSPKRCGRGDIRPVLQGESPDSSTSELARHEAYLRRSNVHLRQKLSQMRFAVQEMEISPTCETCRITPTGSTPPVQQPQYLETVQDGQSEETSEPSHLSIRRPPRCPPSPTPTTRENHLINTHMRILTRRSSFNTALHTASNHYYPPLIPSTSATTLLPSFPLPPNHPSIPIAQPVPPGALFERLALTSKERHNPIQFHTASFAAGTHALKLGACTFVDLPYASNEFFRLETIARTPHDTGRPRRVLDFFAEVVGAERRGVCWLLTRVDITSTILDLAKAKIARWAAPGRGLLDEVDWDDCDDTVSAETSDLEQASNIDTQIENDVMAVSPETYAFSTFLGSIKRAFQSFFVLCPARSNSAPYRLDAKIDIPEFAEYVVAYASRRLTETGLEGSGFDDSDGDAFAEGVQERRMCKVRMTVEEGHAQCEKWAWFVPLGDGEEVWWICFLVKNERNGE